MTRGRQRAVVVAAVVIAAAVGAGFLRYRMRAAASRYAPPVWVDAPPGPRAPESDLLGARVGYSHVEDVRALASRWGIACADRSVRVLMGEMRDKKRAEIEVARAQGSADAVTGASILTHETARDKNPQIRFSCDDVPSARLMDRARAPSTGRLLYVFDDAHAPLRHVSYQRNHPSFPAALADFTATSQALAARFGAPRETGTPNATPGEPLVKYARRGAEFRYSDVVVQVTLANLGGRGFAVGETLEIPLPIRADAVARPR